MITKDQQKFYNNNGYLILDQLLQESQCDALIKESHNLLEKFDVSKHQTIFSSARAENHNNDEYFLNSAHNIHFFLEEGALSEEGKLIKSKQHSINKIGHALHKKNKIFKSLAEDSLLLNTLNDLDYGNPFCVSSMCIFKPPQLGSEVLFHQDNSFLFSYPKPVIALWLALEDANIGNGCLYAIAGSHKLPLKSRLIEQKEGNYDFEIYEESVWEKEKSIPLEVKKGSVIVMHGKLAHGSDKNKSLSSRHACALHYVDKKSYYSKKNWLKYEF